GETEILPSTRTEIQGALAYIVVEIDLVMQRKLDAIDKPVLKLRFVQSITPGIGGGRTPSGGEDMVEPVKHQGDIHFQCGYVFPPAQPDYLFRSAIGHLRCAHLATIAIFQRKLGEELLVSNRSEVLAAAYVSVVRITQPDL